MKAATLGKSPSTLFAQKPIMLPSAGSMRMAGGRARGLSSPAAPGWSLGLLGRGCRMRGDGGGDQRLVRRDPL